MISLFVLFVLFVGLIFACYVFVMSFLCFAIILIDFVLYYVCKSFKFAYCGVKGLFKWLYWRLIRLV